MIEIVLWIYKPNITIVLDPTFSMIGFIIFSECWTNGDNIAKIFIVFFFNQLQNKVIFSTPCLANEYILVWFFNIACHSFLFDAGLTRLWRKSIIYIHKATFNTLCKFFIPIVSMYAWCKIFYRVLSYTTCHLFKMFCSQWWCMKGERFIIKFW